MPYSIRADEENRMIDTVLSGPIDMELAASMSAEAGRLGEEHGYTRFLFDGKDAQLTATTMELHDFASTPEDHGMHRGHKRALVYSGNRDDFSFFETVSQNKGYLVACFTDREKATDWLLKD